MDPADGEDAERQEQRAVQEDKEPADARAGLSGDPWAGLARRMAPPRRRTDKLIAALTAPVLASSAGRPYSLTSGA